MVLGNFTLKGGSWYNEIRAQKLFSDIELHILLYRQSFMLQRPSELKRSSIIMFFGVSESPRWSQFQAVRFDYFLAMSAKYNSLT